jgi:hypothetical protein
MSGATSIDRALLGANHKEDVQVKSIGASVCVRVLSPVEIMSLGVALDAIKEPSGGAVEMGVVSRVLPMACTMPDGSPAFESADDVLRLPADVTRELWAAYWRSHERTHNPPAALFVSMRDEARSDARNIDRVRVRLGPQIVAYFGVRSALDATAAQVLWVQEMMRNT